MGYTIREALIGLRRAPLLTMLSVVAIGFSLFVVGLFALTTYNLRLAIEQIEERVEVVAYLRDGTTDEQAAAAQRELRALPEIGGVRYVSKPEALATAASELAEFREVFTDLESNPLPASLEVRLRPGQRTPESVERVARRVQGYGFVEDVRFGREWLEKIVFLRRIAAGVAGVIGGAFALVAAIVIAAAIRIAVFARREEIAIMRLVGATGGFIQRPFLLEGAITGLLGGCLAVLLTFATYRYVDVALLRVAWVPPAWALAGVAIGAAFGLLSSGFAVRRHLRVL